MVANSWNIGLFAHAIEVYGSGYKERMIEKMIKKRWVTSKNYLGTSCMNVPIASSKYFCTSVPMPLAETHHSS